MQIHANVVLYGSSHRYIQEIYNVRVVLNHRDYCIVKLVIDCDLQLSAVKNYTNKQSVTHLLFHRLHQIHLTQSSLLNMHLIHDAD